MSQDGSPGPPRYSPGATRSYSRSRSRSPRRHRSYSPDGRRGGSDEPVLAPAGPPRALLRPPFSLTIPALCLIITQGLHSGGNGTVLRRACCAVTQVVFTAWSRKCPTAPVSHLTPSQIDSFSCRTRTTHSAGCRRCPLSTSAAFPLTQTSAHCKTTSRSLAT